MDFRVFSRNISENMHARCVREDTKQALKGNLQADGVQSRQTLFVRYCPISKFTASLPVLQTVLSMPDRSPDTAGSRIHIPEHFLPAGSVSCRS